MAAPITVPMVQRAGSQPSEWALSFSRGDMTWPPIWLGRVQSDSVSERLRPGAKMVSSAGYRSTSCDRPLGGQLNATGAGGGTSEWPCLQKALFGKGLGRHSQAVAAQKRRLLYGGCDFPV